MKDFKLDTNSSANFRLIAKQPGIADGVMDKVSKLERDKYAFAWNAQDYDKRGWKSEDLEKA